MGDPAPAVQLRDPNGQMHDLAEYRGRVVAVDFWATWCTVCRRALPALDAMARRHGANGLTVLAVSIDSNRSAVDSYWAQHLPEPALTLLLDADASVMGRFGADGMPALFVIDRAGVVQMVEAGYSADQVPAIDARIEALLSAPPSGASAASARSD